MLYADMHPLPEESVRGYTYTRGYTCLLISLNTYSGMIQVNMFRHNKKRFSLYHKRGYKEIMLMSISPRMQVVTIKRHIGTLGQRLVCLKLPGYLEGPTWIAAEDC